MWRVRYRAVAVILWQECVDKAATSRFGLKHREAKVPKTLTKHRSKTPWLASMKPAAA